MMKKTTRWRLLTSALALTAAGALLASCGGSGSGQANTKTPGAADVSPAGDIPDTQAFVTFSSPDGTFSLKVPEGWSRTQTGSATVFTDKFNSVRVGRHERARGTDRCVCDRFRGAQRSRPRVATSSSGRVSTVSRPAGEAVLIKYQAASSG